METNTFNEQESLKLINQMIGTARGNLEKGAGKYFILWGYVILIPSIFAFLVYLFKLSSLGPITNNIWFVAYIVGAVATVAFIIRDKKKTIVKTYVEPIIGGVWMGFGVGVFFLIVILMYTKQGVYTYPSIVFLYTYALFISSRIYKLKWMNVSVVICFLSAISFLFLPFTYYPLVMAITMLCGNIIPGHLLNKLANK